jgi:hypothetical protein
MTIFQYSRQMYINFQICDSQRVKEILYELDSVSDVIVSVMVTSGNLNEVRRGSITVEALADTPE